MVLDNGCDLLNLLTHVNVCMKTERRSTSFYVLRNVHGEIASIRAMSE